MLHLLLACTDYTVEALPPGANGVDVAPIVDVDPSVLTFEPLALGDQSSLPVTVSNVGDAALTLDEPVLTGSSAFSLVDGEAASLAAGESVTWRVEFSPVNPNDEGVLTLASDDPERPTVTVPITGAALAPALGISPNPYDLGGVPVGCWITRPITLTNVGLAPLVIDAVAEDGEGWSLAAAFSLPLTLEPGEDAATEVTFRPEAIGASAGALYVTSNDFSPLRTSAHSGEGVRDASVVETFLQGDGPWDRTDILLYVDGSCSMVDNQANLAANFASFTGALESLALDWQMIVATADDGCANDWFDARHNQPRDLLAAVRGPVGWYTEAGLTIAAHALEKTDAGECNAGFLRSDSKTTIILVSDEPEQSGAPAADRVGDIQDPAPTAAIHAVVGDVPGGCRTAAPGWGYDEAATLTNGAFLSICDADWGAYFATIADRVASGLTDRFALASIPDPATLAVTVDAAISSEWAYEADANVIVFDEDAWPPAGAQIIVSYELDVDCED